MNDTSFIEPLSDADFTELFIRHMVLSPEVNKKAKFLKVVGDDMMLDDTFGNPVCREIVNIVNSVETIPMTAASLFNGLKRRFEEGILDDSLKDSTLEFLQYVFDESRPLEKPEFFDNKLADYIKKRRAAKIINQYRDDIPSLTRELNKLSVEVSGVSALSQPRFINPFVKAIIKTKTAMIGTGISKLDTKLDGGLKLGEYAQLIGFSGGGKTAVGINMVGLSAEMGRPSTYISCEEHEDDLSQRCYSRVYRIPYRQLRNGSSNIELESRFNEELTEMKRQILAKNLCMLGLKGVEHTLTANYMHELLTQHYEKTGFVPEFVMLDQLEFMEPDTKPSKSASKWDIQGTISEELDELSHRTINGKQFVLWVQHQAKGKTKAYFNREEIQGLKAIINKADLVVGVGRANETINEINLFPLKVRHSAEFKIRLQTDFEHMTVTSNEVSDTLDFQTATTSNPTMTPINNRPILPNNPFK
jgi:hypothetical protein